MSPAPAPGAITLAGPAGPLEAVIDMPDGAAAEPAAFLIACHPHPLHGGTKDNKVVTTLARSANALGMPCIRFNYRGVGDSAGQYDEGRGETEDALAVIAAGRQRWPRAALWLAGFSFGGLVALRASVRAEAGEVQRLVTVAPALGREYTDPADIVVPRCPWLIVQGDADEVIDGSLVIEWARRITPPPRLVVLEGCSHFFHRRLVDLQQVVQPFLQSGT